MMSAEYKPRIEGTIEAAELSVGQGVVIEKGAVISGPKGPASKVVLGDFCFVGREARIMVPEFSLGDYSRLHAFTFAYGDQPLQIGRNCWFGGNVVLDSQGGLDIDDNVGVGAQSQIWTHAQFGDIVEGCRFFSRKYMHIEKDVWLVGHCIVSPVRIGEKSMAMVGSVITKDMLPNHIYAGVPATDITEKLGPQFDSPGVEDKAAKLEELIDRFVAKEPQCKGQLVVVRSPDERPADVCWFDVSTRTYSKTYGHAEVAFLKAHVPLVKFMPDGEPPFVVPRPTPAISVETGSSER